MSEGGTAPCQRSGARAPLHLEKLSCAPTPALIFKNERPPTPALFEKERRTACHSFIPLNVYFEHFAYFCFVYKCYSLENKSQKDERCYSV